MKTFNLSRWALEHKSFVVYLMLIVALAGIFEYRRLGRDEDPPFTIKTMVVKTLWPGPPPWRRCGRLPTSEEARRAAQPRLREKLHQARRVRGLRLSEGLTPPRTCPISGTRCEKVADIKQTLPQGVQGPFFNDEFGDTYALIFAARTASPTASCAIMPSACRPNCSAFPMLRRSTFSAPRTRKSIWSSRRSSSPPWGSTFPS